MNRPRRVADVVIVLVKAVLIAAAIMWLGGYFGLRVREAGGSATAAHASPAASL